ncbi:MAG: Maf family nucleotide pyrophosphatase [Candidatus Omnitrophica bacterium]|nr:Maf family nucleotide pyrophosphatase [Candidatus Omnitrophota bacterium]MDD5653212.1 Maf family nucleotide pyrophosphatase [Candidatus Omnitrophota bacterium]
MKQIYLASDSRARKKILRDFGLKFKVLPSHIRESRNRGNLSFSGLAKKNALEKAKAAAKKVKSGLIIAADTFVVQGKSIFGKPKDLKDARRMLKAISRKPQWLYTGIAVIDKGRKKTLVGCEKTKIYMDPLNDKEISAYFAQVNPLDKAGSFDIQGKGAFFIRRIEGCFYNVVGLPVYKLFKMLKKLNVVLYCVACIVYGMMLAGCTTEYNIVTGEEESYMYSTDKEVQMGEAIDKEVENEFKMVDDPLVEKRVKDIGKKIAVVCDRKDIDYHFRVLEDEEVNAFSLPGGYVYVNKGLVEKCSNDDELAGVIGHEVGHIVARHSIKKLQAQQLYAVLMVAAAGTGSGNVAAAADQAFTQIMLGYSREDELLADQLGTRYARLAGYNPKAMITFLTKLQDINRRRPLQPMNYFKTHPYVPDRIRIVKQELGQGITFNDYINIEQLPHQNHDEQAQ